MRDKTVQNVIDDYHWIRIELGCTCRNYPFDLSPQTLPAQIQLDWTLRRIEAGVYCDVCKCADVTVTSFDPRGIGSMRGRGVTGRLLNDRLIH